MFSDGRRRRADLPEIIIPFNCMGWKAELTIFTRTFRLLHQFTTNLSLGMSRGSSSRAGGITSGAVRYAQASRHAARMFGMGE